MSTKASPKKSLLHYFKLDKQPAATPTEGDNGSNGCDDKIGESPKKSPEGVGRRPTRASASRARLAWSSKEPVYKTSSSEDDDDEEGTRKRRKKRGRNSTTNNKQANSSKNSGRARRSSGQEKDSGNKKKAKLDPETEAFLRSGVPDVIRRSQSKSQQENGKKTAEVEIVEVTPKRKELDAATLAFLHSGVPDIVMKAKHVVEKRREEDEFLMNMGFFPRTSHTFEDKFPLTPENVDSAADSSVIPFSVASVDEGDDDYKPEPHIELSGFQQYMSCEDQDQDRVELCCNENPIQISSQQTPSVKGDHSATDNTNNSRPWIDKLKVTHPRDLVVDKNGLETLTRWLKQWKMDIKDDGGTSRKIEKRKRRGDSADSDFVTSDEEESEMKKKSVLLTGPTGSGKTTAVYVVAKYYGFEVVEVNFSSRRPGKEVLQRVEEGVLSHRLKSSQNSLILFKDIDLLHPEEDEGFCSAVAQLITTAVRPIVMTTCQPVNFTIDSKLDRKDPLRICFTPPKPGDIVQRILKPLIHSSAQVTGSQIESWLDSIVRHSSCDIRQSINQLQLLLSTSINQQLFEKTRKSVTPNLIRLTSEDIHFHSSPFRPYLPDLNFPRQAQASTSQSQSVETLDDDNVKLMSTSARKKKCARQLSDLASHLELFADLDFVSHFGPGLNLKNVNAFGDLEEATFQWNNSEMRAPFFTRLGLRQRLLSKSEGDSVLKELVLESDDEVEKWIVISGTCDEISQYCDCPIGGIDWESCSAVRTIVKKSLLDSFGGRMQKRHGRSSCYFNRLNKTLTDKISQTLGFQEEVNLVKEAGL